jgi:hypothetical protein
MDKIGYKAFNPGMICRGKQYEENAVFEEPEAKICNTGMHYCKNPFDVLEHYGFVNDNAEINEFAEVEALADEKTDDGRKFCTTKLKIGAKLSIHNFVNAFVEVTLKRTNGESAATNTGNRSAATNTGDWSAATNTGDWSAATNTGNRSAATNTGDWSAATNTGNRSAATNTGNWSAATNTGTRSAATNTGNQSAATNTGDWSAATNTGNRSAATNTGDWSAATNTGNRSAATNTGDWSAATNTGDWSAATNTGNWSAATNTGKDGVAVSWGRRGKTRGEKGCYLVLAEYDDSNNLVCAKMEKVDGERIKENTFYTLKNGEFAVAEEQGAGT